MSTNWLPALLSFLRIVVGITLLRYAFQKLFGFRGATDENFQTVLGGIAGILALPGGLLMILGLFTRPTAFVLSAVTGVAYLLGSFQKHYLWTEVNGGESAVFYCAIFLFLGAAGAGSLSLDRLLSRKTSPDSRYASPEWAPYLLSLARIVIGFLFLQHGSEKLFGFPTGTPDFNFSNLRAWAGPIEFFGGILIMLGFFTRPVAFLLSGEMAVAYFVRLPVRGSFWNSLVQSGNAIYYCFVFLFMSVAGGGPWSLDAVFNKKPDTRKAPATQTQVTSGPR